jgi:tetratricopeptide (TPR) repeat protein
VDPAAAREAARAYGRAVALDSGFALAWARLARAEVFRYQTGESSEGRDTVARSARRAADQALRLAPERPESHYALALVRSSLDLDPRGALEAARHAHALAPKDVDVLSLLAGTLAGLGRPDDALARFAEAARLDPRSVTVARRYANALTFQGRFREADSVASAALRLAPENLALLDVQVGSRLARGDTAGARAALRAALRHVAFGDLIRNTDVSGYLWTDDSLLALALGQPAAAFADDRPEALLELAWVQWSAGRYRDARVTADSAVPPLEAQRVRQPADPRVPALLMMAYAWTGRRDQALAELERWKALVHPERNTYAGTALVANHFVIDLLSGHPDALAWADSLLHQPGGLTPEVLRVYPGFAPLRSDPRFRRLAAN